MSVHRQNCTHPRTPRARNAGAHKAPGHPRNRLKQIHVLPRPWSLPFPHNLTILHAHALHAHFAHTRRLRPATRRLRPAFRLRPPIQLRLANISLLRSNCATRQHQPHKTNTQQEHCTAKHTAAHTERENTMSCAASVSSPDDVDSSADVSGRVVIDMMPNSARYHLT